MALFHKVINTRCLGDKDSQCEHYINKQLLADRHNFCPKCGSSVEQITALNNVVVGGVVLGLVATIGGGFYWASSSLDAGILRGLFGDERSPELQPTASPSPKPETETKPQPTASPTPKPETETKPQPTASPTPKPETETKPQATESPTPKPETETKPKATESPTPLAPSQSPPSEEDIQKAIAKLQTMNPNDRLEFPVDAEVLKLEGEYNYRVIGFQENEQYLGLTVQNVEALLQEGLAYNGRYPEASTITLIIRNQATKQRLILHPMGKNHPMDLFVNSIKKGLFFRETSN